MKAVILAAGKGKRMGELTKDLPKPLIKIEERPFLYFLIKNLHKAGITDIGIVVGHKKEKIAEFIEEHDIKAELIEQEKPLGTANAIYVAKDFTGDDDFIALNGDNIYSIEDLQSMKNDDDYTYIGALVHDHPERYGVLKSDGDILLEIIEKPQIFVGNLINSGMYKFTRDIFSTIDRIGLSPRGEYEITDALNLLAAKRKVKIVKLKRKWLDLTSPDDIGKVREELNNSSFI